MLTHDLEIRAEAKADPLCYNGRLRAITGYAMLVGTRKVQAIVARIKMPILVLQGTADKWVRPDGAEFVVKNVSSTDKELITYEGFYHEIFNEVGRQRVMADVGQWIRERL